MAAQFKRRASVLAALVLGLGATGCETGMGGNTAMREGAASMGAEQGGAAGMGMGTCEAPGPDSERAAGMMGGMEGCSAGDEGESAEPEAMGSMMAEGGMMAGDGDEGMMAGDGDGGMMGHMMDDGGMMGGGDDSAKKPAMGCPMMGEDSPTGPVEAPPQPSGGCLLATLDTPGLTVAQTQGTTKVTATLESPLEGNAAEIRFYLVAEDHTQSLETFDPHLDASLAVGPTSLPDGPAWTPGANDLAMGGHHREGTLSFPAFVNGEPVLSCGTTSLSLFLYGLADLDWELAWTTEAGDAP